MILEFFGNFLAIVGFVFITIVLFHVFFLGSMIKVKLETIEDKIDYLKRELGFKADG